MSEAYLEARGIVQRFPGRRRGAFGRRAQPVTAVAGVSLAVPAGGAYGLVGESGSGKTTLARVLAGLAAPVAGQVRVAGERVRCDRLRERRRLWRRVQYVHQNPRGALNPRLPVGRIVAGPVESLLGITGEECEARVQRALERVGLEPDMAQRLPHAFSGGQAQRIAIARAVAAEPALLVLDEPTSALDVRVQAGVLALLAKLREELGVALLLISHDLPVVASVCSEVGVLRRGALVEQGPCAQVFRDPQHAYTRELLSAVPALSRARSGAEGTS